MLFIKEALATGNADKDKLRETVAGILRKVAEEGDRALAELTQCYDDIEIKPERLRVSREEVAKAYQLVEKKTVEGLQFAAEQIKFFAEQQLSCLKPLECQNVPGVTLGHHLVPILSCGTYIPAGRYPLPSSALMSIIPARVAGVKRIVACSPPVKEFSGIHPVVLVAMDMAGVDEIYCMGGAQAIAAYTYGTATVLPVDIIVGPGNKFVAEAKRQVSGEVGIDMLAGPSEVLIIADNSASPQYIAIDLLAQCEHDPTARGILVTTSRELAYKVQEIIRQELKGQAIPEIISRAWEENGQIILADNLEEALKISDSIAPEHLVLQTVCNKEISSKVSNYGSLFSGEYAAVAFGDYVSGTNHILPTASCSRFSNGLWVGTFIKIASYQQLTTEGAARLADTCMQLAEAEGLLFHRRSAELRKKGVKKC